jgi:hypothetical protein
LIFQVVADENFQTRVQNLAAQCRHRNIGLIVFSDPENHSSFEPVCIAHVIPRSDDVLAATAEKRLPKKAFRRLTAEPSNVG